MGLGHMRKSETCGCPGNCIEGFKSTHWKEDMSWVNGTASLDYM
ncbi:hypothetical protein Hanom_Chr11g01031021 [Helianthus anomalus]